MCGIVGYIGPREAAPILLDGLSKLEYRGYDSAGVAVLTPEGLETRRAEGKLYHLTQTVARHPIAGRAGIGHTRWATHGRPSEANAHPHRVGPIAVVHNGIIENHLELKAELAARGARFESETDTEIIAHLIAHHRAQGLALPDAVTAACRRLEGAYSIVVIDETTPDTLVGARLSSPLVVGIGACPVTKLDPDAGDAPERAEAPPACENFLASDVPAILGHTRDVIFLDEGTLAVVQADRVELRDIATAEVLPPTAIAPTRIHWSPAMAEKGGFKHFMLKEIHEQPQALADTLRGRVSLEQPAVHLDGVELDTLGLHDVRNFYIVACGTSWHAGLVARYLFEDLAGLAPLVEYASELRYRNAPMDAHTLVLAISQSGETADTLAAIRHARAQGAKVVSVCNVLGSSIPRLSDGTLYTHAGPEIGVASTKAFTTQIAALHLLALAFGRELGRLDDETLRAELRALRHAASWIERVLEDTATYQAAARAWSHAASMLFLGRGNLFPIALEGALKLKEISYIHAEGYPAGEMKHGPIALIEESVPTVVLNPRDRLYEKVRSNRAEVRARSGPVFAVITEGDEDGQADADFHVTLPAVPEHVLPLVASVPMQLLAYYMADHKGTDVDQPRNLAKSVTVE